MTDPVVTADGYTYERSAITQWLSTSYKSPITGLDLEHNKLTPNQSIRTLLNSLIDAIDLAEKSRSCLDESKRDREDLPSSKGAKQISESSSSRKRRPESHGIARAAFDGSEYGDTYLVFSIGDRIIALQHPEAANGWSFGMLLATARGPNPSRTGWFPEDYLDTIQEGALTDYCLVCRSFDGRAWGAGLDNPTVREGTSSDYLAITEGTSVESPSHGDEQGWVKVQMPNGTLEGWVPASCLRQWPEPQAVRIGSWFRGASDSRENVFDFQ
jgi:hypothetical protein